MDTKIPFCSFEVLGLDPSFEFHILEYGDVTEYSVGGGLYGFKS